MTPRDRSALPPRLFEKARQALVTCSEGLDAAAVLPETPLAALIFDSLMAAKFIATVEADLGVADLPFERFLAEHSERADALTVGSLVEWLGTFPDVRAVARPDGEGA